MMMKILTHPAVRFSVKCYETAMIVGGVYILFCILKHMISIAI